jgi:hypothetical protein
LRLATNHQASISQDRKLSESIRIFMNCKLQNLFALLLIITFSGGAVVSGQQQINNPGFEDWEEIRSGVDEPVHWNSIKNTDAGKMTNRMAPEVASWVNHTHGGTHALKLVNKSTMGIIANGMLTNGAIHGEMDKSKSYVYTDTSNTAFSTHFTSRPDSLTGWYRYKPEENDSAMVVALLHNGYVTLPDHGTKSNWVGGVKLMLPATKEENWVRFSAPLTYFKEGEPEYILIVFSAGNRQQAVKGSTAYIDDVQLIYNKPK